MITEKELQKAYQAYGRGEMPISRWTKAAFVSVVEEALGFVPDWVRTLPKIRMYDFLKESGIYITGNRRKYRHTVFFMVDIAKVSQNCT